MMEAAPAKVWRTQLLLALLAASGLFTVNLMPVLVTGLQTALGFSGREAGFIAAANAYGTVAGSLFAALAAARWSWRSTAATGLVAIILIDLASFSLTSFEFFAGLRFFQGFAGGTVTGVAFSVIARRPMAERTFGMLLFIQFGVGGLGIAVLPHLVSQYGMAALFGTLALLALGALLIVPRLPRSADGKSQRSLPEAPECFVRPMTFRLAAMAALFLFQTAHMSLSACVLDIGRIAGLTPSFISIVAGAAGAAGALGSLAAVATGLRFGRMRPLSIAISFTLLGGVLLLGAHEAVLFVLAALFGSVCWTFALSYLLALCSAEDASGQSGSWSSFVSKLGLATGPLAGALLVSDSDFHSLILTAVGLNGAALLMAVLAVRKHQAVAAKANE